MNEDDQKILRRLQDRINVLLTRREQLGISNLPMEFNGLTAEMLFNEFTSNKSLVLFIDMLIQECMNKSNEEIIERFATVNAVITRIFDNLKKMSEGNKLE